MAAQDQELGGVLSKAAAFEDVNDASKEVSDPGYGFNRFTTDSTVASLNATCPWSRGISTNSGMDWQELHAVEDVDGAEASMAQRQARSEGLEIEHPWAQEGTSDEHPCMHATDEHPCMHFPDEALPLHPFTGPDALTDQEAFLRALAIIETTSRSIREHASLEVSLEVALEFDQEWKSSLNDRLRPLRRASALLAATLADAVPAQYMSEAGDLIYLKADHLDKIAESLRIVV